MTLLSRFLKPPTIDGFVLASLGAPGGHRYHDKLRRGDYENAERAAVKAALLPTDRVLEGGGGLGIVSLSICRIVGSDRLLVYEPLPTAAEAIRQNGAANGMQIRVISKALSDESGITHIQWSRKFHGASIVSGWHGTSSLTVETEAVRDAIGSFNPNVLVLDVEGMETDLLLRAPLTGVELMIIEIHPDILGEDKLALLHKRVRVEGFLPVPEWSMQKVMTFAKVTRYPKPAQV